MQHFRQVNFCSACENSNCRETALRQRFRYADCGGELVGVLPSPPTSLRQRFRYAGCGGEVVVVLPSPSTSLWQRFRYAGCGARRCRLAVSALPCWCWLDVFVWLCLACVVWLSSVGFASLVLVGCFRLALPCLCCSYMATASLRSQGSLRQLRVGVKVVRGIAALLFKRERFGWRVAGW